MSNFLVRSGNIFKFDKRFPLFKMYTFQPYDPSRPRTVCSFKGNQKLIFEGYRYNIHHIVPAKGVKTWRCVCAKKLNGTRSWCKGRAETWDNDENGTSKGEHNHPAEHEVAELEFFKSQLIIAAISCPQINLNELIDKAASLMTTGGENFGNRESLKKSLTSARKQSENGGFKLKSYKNICNNNNKNNKTILKKKNIKEEEEEKIILKENCEILKKTENIEDNNKFKNEEENYLNLFKTPTTTKPSPSLSSTLFSSFYSSSSPSPLILKNNKFSSFYSSSSPSPLILKNNKFSSNSSSLFSYSSPSSSSIQLNNFLDSSSFASSSSSSSGIGSNSSSLNSSPYFNFSSSSSSSSNSSNAFLMALIAAATTTTNCTNLIKNNNEIQQLLKQKEEEKDKEENEEEEEKRKQQIIMLKKKARVNFVFNRLSKKVADSVATNENKDDDYLLKENSKEQQKENYKIKNLLIEDNKKSKEFGTQTEEAEDKNEEKCSTNLIRVCCCDDKLKCTEGRRQKRKLLVPMMYGNGGEGVEGEGRKIVGDCCKNRK